MDVGRAAPDAGDATARLCPCPTVGSERAQEIDQPYLTVGRERYDRVAAAVGVEPRDPFLDLRVISFCVRSCPIEQISEGGWPKAILRRATADRLPAAVRWRRGKEHLGWAFTVALMEAIRDDMRCRVDENLERVSDYVDLDTARRTLPVIPRNGVMQRGARRCTICCIWANGCGATHERPQASPHAR